MIRFNTAYCVQVFNGDVAEGRRYRKVEMSELGEAINYAKEIARRGRAAIVWSAGGIAATYTPASV